MHDCLRAKCFILGSQYCGKTAIVQSFCSDGRDFSKNYRMSTSVEFIVKTVTIPEVNGSIELFLYDVPGQEVFHDLINNYINEANLIVVVFDVTDSQSFSNAEVTLAEFRKSLNDIRIPGMHNFSSYMRNLVALVGNKTDIKSRRVITMEKAQQLANDLNIPYFETSAKEASGIEVPFLYLIKEYYELYKNAIRDYQAL
ncbi:unnamed protein product [Schistosoma turkestanicum]|nr:unnamed protein product [Schistosoma turkestanicum]